MSVTRGVLCTSDGDTHSFNLKTAIGRLHIDGKITREELTEILKQLEDCQQASSVTQSASVQPLVRILREKERRMRAELGLLKITDPRTLPNDPQVIQKVMLTDMQRQVSQMKETVSLVKSQRQELLASIEREEQYKEQLVAVNEKLQEKSNSLEAEDPPQDAVETVTQELENKINAAGKTEEAMMKKLADFVEEHFPLPEPAQIAKTSKDLRSRKQQSGKETLQLKVILLELMTKCVESPNDPYLMLDERHWPAYIELLLRCNIILQHPDNDRRIKLVPFHL